MKYKFLILFCLVSSFCFCQNNQLLEEISLEEAINLATSNSIDFKTSKNNSKVEFWKFQSYKTQFLPSINMSGVLPNYTKSINRITSDNGSDIFISQNQAFSSISFAVEQYVPFTGGKISLTSSLNRLDVFSPNKLTNYSSTPLSISYYQESLFYNSFKWDKKIIPLIYEESKRKLSEDIEKISLTTSTKFFDYILAEVKFKNAKNNRLNQDTIAKIAKGRFNIGKLYKNDLLQAELALLNSRKEFIVSRNQLKQAKRDISEQLGFTKNKNFKLKIPNTILFTKIDSTTIFQNALENKKMVIEQRRKVIQAKQEIAKINSDDIKIGVSSNFGFTQQGNRLPNVYNNLLVQQNLSLTLSIPIFNWGKRDSDKKIAISNLELVRSQNLQELSAFKRELELKLIRWNELEISIEIASKASEIAIDRYNVTKNRFYISKITITDLNIAQTEKDAAVYNYYEVLKEYWEAYYEIRKLSLYDFIEKKRISHSLLYK